MRDSFLDYLFCDDSGDGPSLGPLRGRSSRLREPIGRLARRQGWLAGEDLDRILDQQRDDDRRFGELAADMGLLAEAQIRSLLHLQRLREAVQTAELLVCTGHLSLDDAMTSLGAFLRTLGSQAERSDTAPTKAEGVEIDALRAELARTRRDLCERDIQLSAARSELAAEREAHDLNLDPNLSRNSREPGA